MKAAERKRRKCAGCGAPIPAGVHGNRRYCSRQCRDKAFYQAHAAEKAQSVSRYQKRNAEERRKFMREYMRRYRAGK